MIRNKFFIMLLFLGICSIARGQTSQYWFDSNYDGAVSSGVTKGTIDVDLSGLQPGVHTLHYLCMSDRSGVPSSTYSMPFLVPHPEMKGNSAEYWFDQNYANCVKTTEVGNITVDASALKPGVHTLNYHQLYDRQIVSSTYAYPFLVPEPTATATKGEYWFDGNYEGRKQLALSTQAVAIDLSGLTPGLHAVRYHALTAEGLPSTTYTGLFWIGTPESKVKAYHYWVNDLTDQLQTVALETPVANYKLTAQIDVPKLAIRKEMFHFEIQDEQPKVYAKNTFNIMFENVDGSSIRYEQDYVDYRVSEDIEATLLEPNNKQTVSKPDGLLWFKVEAKVGDMLCFSTNRRCTMHLFSPSEPGKELWTASGQETLSMGGAKADMDGTFYLAVHDVTDQNVTDITVDYQWTPIGDVNGDTETNEEDRTAIVNYVTGQNPGTFDEEAADINNDGKVDVIDIVELNNILNE